MTPSGTPKLPPIARRDPLILRVSNLLDVLSEVSFIIATICFAVTMMIGVIFRYGLNASLPWTDELALIFFVWATFLSIANGYFHGKHVNIGLFIPIMPPWMRAFAVAIAEGLEAAFLLCLLISAVKALPIVSAGHTDSLRIPLSLPFSAMVFSAVLMLVHWLRRTVSAASLARTSVAFLVAAAFVFAACVPIGHYFRIHGGLRGTLIVVGFLFPLIVGVPVAFALGLMGFLYVGIQGTIPFSTGALQIFFGTEIYTYMAIPLLMLSGMLLYTAGVTEKLINFAQILVGRMRGGLGATDVVASLILADISGSAVADTAAIGSAMIPEMMRRGYHADFAAALQAAGGTLGLMFPPAIVLLLYASTISVSVSRLFAASIIPGVLVAASFILIAYIHAVRHGYPSENVPIAQVPGRILRAIPGLFAGVIVVGGILGGIITPAEAGVVLLFYVLMLIAVVYRSATAKKIYRVAVEAGHTSGMTLLLTATSALVGFVLARDLVPVMLVSAITGISDNKYVVLAILNAIFILTGMLVEPPAIIVAFLPSFMPLLKAVGINPLQWGIIFVINAGIGMLHPPVGLMLFVSSAIAKVPFSSTVRAAVPFILVMLINLIIVSTFPIVSLWLPHILYNNPLP